MILFKVMGSIPVSQTLSFVPRKSNYCVSCRHFEPTFHKYVFLKTLAEGSNIHRVVMLNTGKPGEAFNKDHGLYFLITALFYCLIGLFSAPVFTIKEQYG